MSSSRAGALPTHSHSRCESTRALSPRRSRYSNLSSSMSLAPLSPSEVLHFFRDREEGRMPIDLAVRGIEQRRLVAGAAGHDVRRLDDPDADAFVAPRVDVARVVHRHLG